MVAAEQADAEVLFLLPRQLSQRAMHDKLRLAVLFLLSPFFLHDRVLEVK